MPVGPTVEEAEENKQRRSSIIAEWYLGVLFLWQTWRVMMGSMRSQWYDDNSCKIKKWICSTCSLQSRHYGVQRAIIRGRLGSNKSTVRLLITSLCWNFTTYLPWHMIMLPEWTYSMTYSGHILWEVKRSARQGYDKQDYTTTISMANELNKEQNMFLCNAMVLVKCPCHSPWSSLIFYVKEWKKRMDRIQKPIVSILYHYQAHDWWRALATTYSI